MAKKLFLFPGQGSQEIGMGADLFKGDEYFCSLVKQASDIVGEDLKTLCLKGPEKKLIQARFLQPLIVAVSLGYLRRVEEKGVAADFVLGHSLGEISALVAAGVITPPLAIELAARRGELMDVAASTCNGGMFAVSLSAKKVEEIILSLGVQNQAFIANDNSLEQVVVSGDKAALEQLSIRVAKNSGLAKKLNVSGPWHTPYIKDVYEQFKVWVEPVKFRDALISVVLNSTGLPQTSGAKIKEEISMQLYRPVYFRACMDYCKYESVSKIYEIGPGRVLAGLARANGFGADVEIFSVNNLRGVERI
jgi:[acyl-carrier-protein] S-malonyltransferase